MADPSKMQILDSQRQSAGLVGAGEGGRGEAVSPAIREIARRTRKVGEREITEILVVNDIYNVTGGYLTQADAGTDQQGQPCVNFTFNTAGGQLFGELTGNHLPDKLTDFTYKLGIILDGELYSAPSIQSTIYRPRRDHRLVHAGGSARPGERAQRRQPARRARPRSRSASSTAAPRWAATRSRRAPTR